MRELPLCEICGLEVMKVFVCSRCGARFCEECGDVKRRICYDCLNWEEEEDEEYEEEDWEEPDSP
ncbi:hypothetical protein DRO56_00335 [Candidatus Bathyarchaeota archaeon]|nr:hypothetical protein [Candidatus Bathyarchaeota archaeon]RLI33985.1 MAG: hypothetical protein DRO56_00335 [Candidatus Bathyarchaeota archaeon]